MKKNQLMKRRPLLYIKQPEFDVAHSSMQKSYVQPKQKKEEQMPLENSLSSTEKNETDQREPGDENSKDQKTKENSNKKSTLFNDMNIEEKLHLLLDIPKHLQNVKCEVRTNKQTFKGYITDVKNGVVTMKGINSTNSATIDFEKIVSIRMLGL